RDPGRRPVKGGEDGRHQHGGAEPGEAAYHSGDDGDKGSDQEGKAQQIRHREPSSSIAVAHAGHHIMRVMPSKNLAVSAVPLLMPYIQRRPVLEHPSQAFKLVSDYKPAGDQPEAIRQLIEGVSGGEKDQVLLGVTGS